MTDAAVTELQPSVLDSLRQIAGNDHVLTGAEDLQFYSSDVLREADPAEVVLQPGTKEELAQAVKTATEAGLAVIPRGGGLSYTDGYLPQRTHSMIVDMRRLDRIVEINTEDMLVTVEPGVYQEQQARETLVHSLEHGLIVIYYDQPDPAAFDILKDWAGLYGGPWSGIVVAPKAGFGEAIVLTSWNRLLRLGPFDPDAAAAFIDAFRGRGPERPVR